MRYAAVLVLLAALVGGFFSSSATSIVAAEPPVPSYTNGEADGSEESATGYHLLGAVSLPDGRAMEWGLVTIGEAVYLRVVFGGPSGIQVAMFPWQ